MTTARLDLALRLTLDKRHSSGFSYQEAVGSSVLQGYRETRGDHYTEAQASRPAGVADLISIRPLGYLQRHFDQPLGLYCAHDGQHSRAARIIS